jgi:hypothetical protein
MNEKQIENNILCFLEEIGIWAKKINTVGVYDSKKKIYRKSNSRFTQVGMPDIIGIMDDGRFLGIEVKARRGKLSDAQREVIRELQSRQGLVFISRSVAQTFETLRPFLTDHTRFEHIAAKWAKIESHAETDH